MSTIFETHLEELGLKLPAAPTAAGNYVPYVRSGPLLYVSGQLPIGSDGAIMKGRLGADVNLEEGWRAAQLCALNILAQANAALGGLEHIARVVRLNGFVAATPEFTDHPKVINGASDLIAEVLGEAGRHTRIAVGVASLPLGAAVEIDAVIETK